MGRHFSECRKSGCATFFENYTSHLRKRGTSGAGDAPEATCLRRPRGLVQRAVQSEATASRAGRRAVSALCKESPAAQGFSLAPHIPQGTFSCRYAAIHLGSLLAIKSQGLRPLTIPERLFRQAETRGKSPSFALFPSFVLFLAIIPVKHGGGGPAVIDHRLFPVFPEPIAF